MKDLDNFEVTLNTKQGLELINVINKLGLKDQLKEFALGTGETGKKKRALLIREQQYHQAVLSLVEQRMTKEEFDNLGEAEKNCFLKEILTEDVIKMSNELNKMQEELNELAGADAFDLFYTAVIERLYSNQDVIFKTLASIYYVKVKDLEKQKFVETALMIKKIIESPDIQNFIKVFL